MEKNNFINKKNTVEHVINENVLYVRKMSFFRYKNRYPVILPVYTRGLVSPDNSRSVTKPYFTP